MDENLEQLLILMMCLLVDLRFYAVKISSLLLRSHILILLIHHGDHSAIGPPASSRLLFSPNSHKRTHGDELALPHT
jgi:hypothetical protein